jgi:Uma2 family endonuclease
MVTSISKANNVEFFSLEDFIAKPPERTEWVDGKLIEKTAMTYKHGLAQSKLTRYWGDYIISSGQGGEICVETLCRTNKQARRPDVAYISAELLEQFGTNFTILPQSFPLLAEVASPDDSAEELFAKSQEYLEAGCQEVWLLFPETRLVLINTPNRWQLFNTNEVVTTQNILTGFSMAVADLLI